MEPCTVLITDISVEYRKPLALRKGLIPMANLLRRRRLCC